MKEEEIIEAVYKAALDHINSVVPAKRIDDLDIVVSIDNNEISIDITLVTDRGEEIDQRTVDEALKMALEKADDLMKKS
ncbi:DUF3194 domain-containing protein [Methanocella sp. CWC-04]|uniref:DUF3194 domain-containing protein n=1 Tax=Methanooceanicella nereidis TaxID=2052831 RepID=A0AAP2REZ4_9EURY|nr:DUF3194 domain-containing protein [Methanocella sp. CWC-04]MCD1296139.1 DUF3194 domain-containing protein [Methanocella sp. CWC-04]